MKMRRFWVFVATMAVALSAAAGAQADDRDDYLNKIEENEQKIAEYESQLEGVDTDLQEVYLELEKTSLALETAKDELSDAEENLAAAELVQQQTADRMEYAQQELSDVEEEIDQAQVTIDSAQDALGELARATYQTGTTVSPTAFMVGSTSTQDYLTQYTAMDSAYRTQTAVLTEVSQAQAVLLNAQARQQAVLARIEELKADADQAVVDAARWRDEASQKKADVEQLQTEQEQYATELEGMKDEISSSITAMEEDNEDARAEIARIDEEERKKQEEAAKQGSSSSSSSTTVSGQIFIRPIDGTLYVTSPYGYRWHPIVGGIWMHYGVDLSSACGNPQYAVADGVVTAVRPASGNGTHGNQVMINNGTINGDRYQTVYNHLSQFNVTVGQTVKQGDIIGYTGATGAVTGCHGHFEVWKNGVTIDPMSLPGY